GLWQSRFGGDPSVLGRRVFVDSEAYEIVGVLPPEFKWPPLIGTWNPVIWLSLNLPASTAHDREAHSLQVIARLKRGISVQQAQAEMDGIARRLAAAFPKENGDFSSAVITPLGDQRGMPEFRSVLWMLLGAAGLVLLIACANVAGLLMVRGAARE